MTDPAARWSAQHAGIAPSSVPLLEPLLRTLWWVARPLARWHVPPTLLTVFGVVLATDALFLASTSPLAAAACVVLAVICDGLDGAVAVVGAGGSRGGALADAVADRISDVAFALVIWRCGAPLWLAVSAGVLAVVVDGVRRVRGGAVRARITVGERPTWMICATLACVCAAASDATWPATVCASVACAAGVIAVGQVALSR